MSVILFIIILAVLIFVHEFGHFIIAKAAKIRVDEFGFGFPPKIWGYKPKKSETEYTINWIPFGGFVKIFGETPDEESISGVDRARSLIHKPKYIQAAVMAGGVLFNLLFAWLLISFGFMSGLPSPVGTAPAGENVMNPRLVITNVYENSPANEAGLRGGDVILSAEVGEESLIMPSVDGFSDFIAAHGSEEITVSYERGQEKGVVNVVPRDGVITDRPAIGVGMSMVGTLQLPFHKALWEGGKTTVALVALTTTAFWDLLSGIFTGNANLASVTGPVGIVGLVGDASSFGFAYLLGFTAFISINLAIINLIPFPALDGGRLFFLLIETIKRSPIKPVIANTANLIGFVLLILLMIVVTYHDIVRIVTG